MKKIEKDEKILTIPTMFGDISISNYKLFEFDDWKVCIYDNNGNYIGYSTTSEEINAQDYYDYAVVRMKSIINFDEFCDLLKMMGVDIIYTTDRKWKAKQYVNKLEPDIDCFRCIGHFKEHYIVTEEYIDDYDS